VRLLSDIPDSMRATHTPVHDLRVRLVEGNVLVFRKGGEAADFRLKASKGVLLFGPPGCGKSYLMRAAANELGVPIQGIEGPSLLSAGRDGGAHVKEIFYIARENAPSVVLFDDIDLVASAQDRSPETRNLLSLFLAQVDAVGDSERVLALDSTGLVVPAGGRTIAVIGLDDVVVVDTGDALLVTSRERAQDVKKVVELLKNEGPDDLL